MSVAAISRPTPVVRARGNRPRVPDDELRDRVCKAIARFEPIRHVTLPRIRIHAADGLVMLSGHAASDTHKAMAAELAGDVPGVEAVQNEIVSDGELQRGIIRALHEQPATRTVHAGFEVDLGVVTLWGPAPNEAFAKAAPEAVLSVPGVGCVLDMLSLDRCATARERAVEAWFGRTVVCQGRELGPIERLFVQKGSWTLKHALIKHGVLAPEWLLVPGEALSWSDERYVYLDLQPGQLASVPRYLDASLTTPAPGAQPDISGLWRLRPGQRIITRHDGLTGRLAGLRIDPRTGSATHLAVRRGRLMPIHGWLPASRCERWGDDILTLLSGEDVDAELESGQPRDDRDIAMDAYNRILALRWHVEPAGIVGLTADRGRLTVTGKLYDERDAAAVRQSVASVRGVTEVDRLQVTPAPDNVATCAGRPAPRVHEMRW